MVHLPLALLLAFSTATAMATELPCLTRLAFLAADAPRLEALAEAAYLRLWDQLGAKATPETMREVLERGDPFAVTERGDVDLFQLKKNLADLEKLLVTAKGRTEAVSSRLLASLATRITQSEIGAAQTQRAVEKIWPDMSFPYRNPENEYAVSHDSRWLAYFNKASAAGGIDRFTVVNLITKQAQSFDGAPSGSVVFSPDGGSLLFPTALRQIRVVPLRNGVPDFGAGKSLGSRSEAQTSLRAFRMSHTPEFFYATAGEKTYRFHLGEHKYVALKMAGAKKAGETIGGWGPLPSDGGVYLLLRSRDTLHIRMASFTVDDTGTLTPKREMGRWAVQDETTGRKLRDRQLLKDYADGSWVFERDSQIYLEKSDGSEPALLLKLRDVPLPTEHGVIEHWGARPEHDTLYVSYRDTSGMKRWIQLLDIKTGRLLSTVPLPKGTNDFDFTPDGRRIICPMGKAPHLEIAVVNPDKP